MFGEFKYAHEVYEVAQLYQLHSYIRTHGFTIDHGDGLIDELLFEAQWHSFRNNVVSTCSGLEKEKMNSLQIKG